MSGKTTIQDGVEIKMIPLDQLQPPEIEYREYMIDEVIDELAKSLKEHGQLEPIVVRRKGDKYEIIAGMQRFEAAKRAGLTALEAKVIDVNDTDALILRAIENEKRSDIPPMTRARYYKRVIDATGMTISDFAWKIGKSEAHVREHLRLLEASEDIQAAIEAGHIGVKIANLLMQIEDPKDRHYYLKLVVENGASIRVVQNWVREYLAKKEFEKQRRYMAMKRELSTETETPTETEDTNEPPPTPEPPSTEHKMYCEFCGREAKPGHYQMIIVCDTCNSVIRNTLKRLEEEERRRISGGEGEEPEE